MLKAILRLAVAAVVSGSLLIILFQLKPVLPLGTTKPPIVQDQNYPSKHSSEETSRTEVENTNDPVVAAAGDIACNGPAQGNYYCQQNKTAELILKIKPQAVLALGDLQYPKGQYQDFINFYDPSWGKFKTITYPSPGNHEYATLNAAGYFNYFNGPGEMKGPAGDRNQGYYSFNLGTWHLISLNSNCWKVACKKNSPQLTWLAEDLKKHQNFCSLAYFHHPRFSSGIHGNSYFLQPIFELLYQNGVDVILSGHDHDYERLAPQNPQGKVDPKGIRQFVVGTGGKSTYDLLDTSVNSQAHSRSFGVLKLALRSKGYGWDFLSIDGQSPDSGQDVCH